MTGITQARGSAPAARPRVVALSGGVGGAKLALGLSRVLAPGELIVVVNTADDFEHLGFAISPDLDTLMYTLAALADPERGWGRKDETWNFMAALGELGGETWFALGDRDLATHVARTRRLAAGEALSQITDDLSRRLGVTACIVPMSDDRVRTRVETTSGVLDFQDYFVRRSCAPVVTDFAFEGAARARPHPDLIAALRDPELRAVVICPSNPFISIDPILAVPGVREALRACAAPVVAVSPIVGGRAVKGPTAKMMAELGLAVTALSVAEHYGDLLGGFVQDAGDADSISLPWLRVQRSPTLMLTLADREKLAGQVLAFADSIRNEREGRALRDPA